MQAYDASNIFAKILRKEITANVIFETEKTLAFHDAFPQTPLHVLVIPKGNYTNLHDFCARASHEEIVDFWRTVHSVIAHLGLEEGGYRMINNNGIHGGQEVPHFHIHLCGGEVLGPMLTPKK